jgi:hypothetical protein
MLIVLSYDCASRPDIESGRERPPATFLKDAYASLPVEISTREYAMTRFCSNENFDLDAQLPHLDAAEIFNLPVASFAEGALL